MKRLLILVMLVLVGCSTETEIAPDEIVEEAAAAQSSDKSTMAEKITENLVRLMLTALAENIQTKSCEENPEKCDEQSNNLITAQLVRVVDGDTATFLIPNVLEDTDSPGNDANDSIEMTVRFLLVDTPELRGDEPFAKEAYAFTQELLENAKEIHLELDEGDTFDKYDRVLAYIYADGVSVQEELLKSGLAKVAYIKEPNTRHLEEFQLAEEYAKINGQGLWGE